MSSTSAAPTTTSTAPTTTQGTLLVPVAGNVPEAVCVVVGAAVVDVEEGDAAVVVVVGAATETASEASLGGAVVSPNTAATVKE